MALDVTTDAAEISQIIANAEQAIDGIDIVVNNAGIPIIGTFEDMGEQGARNQLETKLLGPFKTSSITYQVKNDNLLRIIFTEVYDDEKAECLLSTVSLRWTGVFAQSMECSWSICTEGRTWSLIGVGLSV
jgi:hypothetical protein